MSALLSIVLCGDALPVRRLENLPASAREVFEIAAKGDLTIGNFEIPLTSRGAPVQKLLNIRADPSIADSLPALGLDIVTIANNHAVDYGAEGLADTRNNLRVAGLTVIGSGENADEASRATFHQAGSRKVGVIAFSCLTPTGMSASDKRAGISALHVETGYQIDPWYQMEEPGDPSVIRIRTKVSSDELARAVALVADAKRHCDLLIVTVHWGFGSGEDLAEYQRPLAEAFIEAGGDIIHGHHPHAIHAIGFHKGKPIIFSAGTYVGQQVFLDASPAVKRLWAGMSADGFLTELSYDEGLEPTITLTPTTLDSERLPRLTSHSEFEAILDRLQRLSIDQGAELLSDGTTITARPIQ